MQKNLSQPVSSTDNSQQTRQWNPSSEYALPSQEFAAPMIPVITKDASVSTNNGGKYFQFLVALLANLMAITDGMAVGWTSPMIPYFLSNKTHIKMTRHQAEWIESFLLIGATAGLPVTAYCVSKIGRKKSLQLGTFVVIICWVLIATSKVVELLYISRFFNGLGLNMAFVAAPMYVAEIAQKEFRGFLSSNVFIMSLLGIVTIYSIGPYVPFYVHSLITVPLLLIELLAFCFIPETPYYLILNNKYQEAHTSLQKFRGGGDVDAELKAIKHGIDLESKESGIKFTDMFLVKNYRKAMLIMLVVNSAQLFCASEVILMNLHEILNESESIYIDSKLAAIVFAVITLFSSIVSSLMVDRLGRKSLMIISAILTGTCLLTIAIYFNLKNIGCDTKTYSWIPVVTIMIYAAVYKFGLGMVPIVLTAEIFAPKLKVVGMTYADGVYVVSSLLALQVFFGFRNLYGMHVPFYIFFGYAMLTCLFVIFYLPETKGKSLDEIQDILRSNMSISALHKTKKQSQSDKMYLENI